MENVLLLTSSKITANTSGHYLFVALTGIASANCIIHCLPAFVKFMISQ